MIRKVYSATVLGVEGKIIEVEVGIAAGLPNLDIIGLPDSVVREARDRIRLAIKEAGFEIVRKNIIVNLAPATIKKVGSSLDSAILVGVLLLSNEVSPSLDLEDTVFIGEVGISGVLRFTNGVLPMVISAKKEGFSNIVIPKENENEVKFLSGINIYAVSNVRELFDVIAGDKDKYSVRYDPTVLYEVEEGGERLDFVDVVGQEIAKRGIVVAVAGGHNILLVGSPGVGKTMLISRIPSILPPMTEDEIIDTTIIYSVKGLLDKANPIVKRRPFREPHHTSSEVAIIGGGKNILPGEISLAHNGILFLDEFPEFKKNVIQALREPLETGEIVIARAGGSYRFPAKFILAISMNPCPCGYLLDNKKPCTCSTKAIKNYLHKIKGPILDRIDIQIEVMRVEYEKINIRGMSSKEMSDMVRKARAIQKERFRSNGKTNKDMAPDEIKKYCVLTSEAKKMLEHSYKAFGYSLRSYHKILKVARTIEDISENGDVASKITDVAIAEAMSYRSLDRQFAELGI